MKKFVLLLIIFTQIMQAAEKDSYKKLWLEEEQPKISLPSGRAYYDSLVERASKRYWAVPITLYYTFENGGFDCNGCSTPLSKAIFGKCPITFQDIYLFSKLSIDNKVRIINCDPLPPDRCEIPIGFLGEPFGAFSDDLYTTLLADVELDIDADQQEVMVVTSGLFHYDFGTEDWASFEIGLNFPFKSKVHLMELSFEGGELFREAFIPDTTQRETALQQFEMDFSGVEDFFNRAILDPKCLTFCQRQQKAGLGDISLFTAFEFHLPVDIQVGFNVVFPTAGKGSGNFVWEPILGNGGAFQFDPFIQCIYFSPIPYLNPFVRLAGEISARFTSGKVRAPTLVTNPVRQQVQNVPNLNHPAFFDMFYVDPFSEYDTCVPLFADKLVCISQKIGSKVQFGIGNYAYGLFNVDFRLGLYYDYYHKTKDSFTSDCDNGTCCDFLSTASTISCVDTCALERCTDQKSHTISASLTYKFSNLFEIAFGGQFVVLGTNVPRTRAIYFNITCVF